MKVDNINQLFKQIQRVDNQGTSNFAQTNATPQKIWL